MYCTECGTTVNDNAKFCSSCGVRTGIPEEVTTAEKSSNQVDDRINREIEVAPPSENVTRADRKNTPTRFGLWQARFGVGRGVVWQIQASKRIKYLYKKGLDTQQISNELNVHASTIGLLSACNYRGGRGCIDSECLYLQIKHLLDSGLNPQGIFETLKRDIEADWGLLGQQPSKLMEWYSSYEKPRQGFLSRFEKHHPSDWWEQSKQLDFVEYLRTTDLDMHQITEDLELRPSTIEWLSSFKNTPDIEKQSDTGQTAPLPGKESMDNFDSSEWKVQQNDTEKNQMQILRRSLNLIIVLWFIIDSSARGLIYPSLIEISWIDMAGANCSVLDNVGYNLQSQCESAKSEAQAVVGVCIFVLLFNIAELLRLLRT